MTIAHSFDTDSQEQKDFLAKYRVGSKLQSPDGGQVWTVNKVEVDGKIPPNPSNGRRSTKVILTLN